MASGPGLLYVTAQPHDSLSTPQFHDWYNNEHGPVRLRLPFVTNGFRYRARGDAKPQWIALYDITDVAELMRAPYTSLREPQHKTRREVETMRQIDLDRRIYDLIYTKQKREMRADEAGAALVVSAWSIPAEHETDFNKWAVDEYIPAMGKTPGWLRSRRYRTSAVDKEHQAEILVMHEFEDKNGINGPEFHAVEETSAYKDMLSTATAKRGPFTWDLQYTFGPAPRELGSLWDASTATFASLDNKTRTYPAPAQPAIESYVMASDGVELPYRLEGCGDPEAPLIVLVNSILVDMGIWDHFVAKFLDDPRHKQFRILRYNARGRSATAGSAVSLDLLTRDLLELLDAVRAHHSVSALGVSLGGATVLNTALKHPNRLAHFVACDTNDVAPSANPKAWGERIAVAEEEGAKQDGKAIVGEQLAEKTVRRWFAEASYDGGSRESEVARVKEMVRTNDLDGFKTVVQALYSYDLQAMMKDATADGMFVVGENDGVLPQTMSKMAQNYGTKGTELAVIGSAGHLPMVEQPAKFAEVVGKFVCRA